AIGVSFILQNVALVLAGSGDRRAPQIFPLRWQISILGASISVRSIFIFVLALTLMFSLQGFVGRTRLGRAMRATAQDREAASLVGGDMKQTTSPGLGVCGADGRERDPDDLADVPPGRRTRSRGRGGLGPALRLRPPGP